MPTPSISRPFVIAGPCVAESKELLFAVAEPLTKLAKELGFDFIFKSSFDKANRSAIDADRGPGMDVVLGWFRDLKNSLGVKILTDVHEAHQCATVAEVCDVLQIPAFLCRQTDLILSAAKTGRAVNIKKGQFMSPGAMASAVEKARAAQIAGNPNPGAIMVTERGVSFGYGQLVVDMRTFPIMAKSQASVIIDITHSTQRPPNGEDGAKSTKADRWFAPMLARAATATGYVDGYFLEVHPKPAEAKSDKDSQLSLSQAEALLKQLIPLWHSSRQLRSIDGQFA